MQIYLNHAGTSWPKPPEVRAAAAAAMRPEASSRWDDDFFVQHEVVAHAFGLAASELLLTPGCTGALALAVGDFAWSEGDVAVVDGLAHQALHGPVRRLASRGVDVEVIGLADGELDLEGLEACIRRRPVRLVALSMGANVTGAVLPYAEVIALAHRHGARVLLDAAQTVGWLSLEPHRLGADMVAFGGHKGLRGPWGIGGLFVAADVPILAPRVPNPPVRPNYCDGGSVDRAALAGLAAAVSLLNEHDLARARGQVARLQETAEARGAEVVGPRDAGRRLPMLAFVPRRKPVGAVAGELRGRGLVVSGGLQCAPLAHHHLGTAPEGVVRLSVGPSTSDAEIDAAIAHLDSTLA